MREIIRRVAALALLAALLCGTACAETEKDGFHFDDRGF